LARRHFDHLGRGAAAHRVTKHLSLAW
jgi:hypothetical protein